MAVTCTGEGRVLRAAISGEVDHHRARAIMEELSRQIDLELPRSLTLVWRAGPLWTARVSRCRCCLL